MFTKEKYKVDQNNCLFSVHMYVHTLKEMYGTLRNIHN